MYVNLSLSAGGHIVTKGPNGYSKRCILSFWHDKVPPPEKNTDNELHFKNPNIITVTCTFIYHINDSHESISVKEEQHTIRFCCGLILNLYHRGQS